MIKSYLTEWWSLACLSSVERSKCIFEKGWLSFHSCPTVVCVVCVAFANNRTLWRFTLAFWHKKGCLVACFPHTLSLKRGPFFLNSHCWKNNISLMWRKNSTAPAVKAMQAVAADLNVFPSQAKRKAWKCSHTQGNSGSATFKAFYLWTCRFQKSNE